MVNSNNAFSNDKNDDIKIEEPKNTTYPAPTVSEDFEQVAQTSLAFLIQL